MPDVPTPAGEVRVHVHELLQAHRRLLRLRPAVFFGTLFSS